MLALDWLKSPYASSASGALVERAWRYLEVTLDRYESFEYPFAYHKAVLEQIIKQIGPSSVPKNILKFMKVRKLTLLNIAYLSTNADP